MSRRHFRTINLEEESQETATPVPGVAPKITQDFLLSGRAFFLVKSPTGKTYTFKIHRRTVGDHRHKGEPSYFVRVLNASEAVERWPYVGVLLKTGKIQVTSRSKFTTGDPEFDVAQWAVNATFENAAIPDGYSIEHIDRCGVCAQTLVKELDKEAGMHDTCSPKHWN